MTPDRYPSVTIVAGDIEPASGPTATYGRMIRMHGGQTYIHIDPATARQWLTVLEPIATAEESK